MLYERATHPRANVGQRWLCTPPGATTVLIVAVDSSPGGFVMNVLVEDGLNTNGVARVLAPIGWQQLEPHLAEVIAEYVDVSAHLSSYDEWKEQAQDGKAGYWRCSPAEVLTRVRKSVDE
jgi:hypothetical protein